MLTQRFHKQRKAELDSVFSKKNIADVWRKVVRQQLRKIDIIDIFDYYDFNYNIDERAILLRNDLLKGHYQCLLPLIFRIEKKYGICRHVVIPQPQDALVLQIITENIRKEILKSQPSKKAFYSQDRHSVSKPHEIDEYCFNWRELWKKMQKQIYEFNEEKELIVISDLANFYDSIDIIELRKKITSQVEGKEVLIDILFKIVERISWLPDYLPYVGRGLPTTNIEGIRLLAHCFLFELDEYLKEATNDSFTRWMDDVVIGVNSKDEAVEILSSSSDILKSRGLAWNIAKTCIYDSVTAEKNFLINENKYFDSLSLNGIERKEKRELEKILLKKFKSHLKNNTSLKYFDKITKRYITSFAKLKSRKLLDYTIDLYENFPAIRPNMLYYLEAIGYDQQTGNILLSLLTNLRIYDDVTLFGICKLVTSWNVPISNEGNEFLDKFQKALLLISRKRKTSFDFYCLLWFKTKYEHPDKLYKFIFQYENMWRPYPILRRMVTCIMARILPFKEKEVTSFLNNQITSGEAQIVSVANHILKFRNLENFETKIRMYLFPEKKSSTGYSLQKFLVLCSVLNSEKCRDGKMKKYIDEYILDSHYSKWIDFQYDIK